MNNIHEMNAILSKPLDYKDLIEDCSKFVEECKKLKIRLFPHSSLNDILARQLLLILDRVYRESIIGNNLCYINISDMCSTELFNLIPLLEKVGLSCKYGPAELIETSLLVMW